MNKSQAKKHNRLCGEEAIARGNTHFLGFCLKHHNQPYRVRITATRWYTECTICTKEHELIKYGRKHKDPIELERIRKNRVIFAKAWRKDKRLVQATCKYHGRTTFKLTLTNQQTKAINCMACSACRRRFAVIKSKGQLPELIQWVVMDLDGKVPDPKKIKLPETDKQIASQIGKNKAYTDAVNPWPMHRTGDANVEKISRWRITLRPDFLYKKQPDPEFLLLGSMADSLPNFRKITTINVVRLKESAEDTVDCYKIPAGFTLFSESDWYMDGSTSIKLEQYIPVINSKN